MGFEVEMKFRADNLDKTSLVASLSEIGAVEESELEHSDIYLRHPCRDFVVTNEAFRLRREGMRNLLTYKGPKQPGAVKVREEIEIAFADGEDQRSAMRTLMARLGFEAVAEVRKTRRTFSLRFEDRSVHVALDQAEELGPFVEVEVLAADEADLPNARNLVKNLAMRLGLRELESRSYLRMLLEQSQATSSETR